MYREFNEINTYIDNIFLGYPETQKNKNIKAELKKNMNLGMEEKIKISNREEDAFLGSVITGIIKCGIPL